LDADQATMLLAEIKSAPVDVIELEERLLDRRWICAGVWNPRCLLGTFPDPRRSPSAQDNARQLWARL